MTLLFGARCVDGVVLVADTKFTINDGSDHLYDREKITGELPGILTGFSGTRRIFECFRTELRDYASSYSGLIMDGIPLDKLINKISGIMEKLSSRFPHNRDNFDLLFGVSGIHSGDGRSELKYFFRDGGHEPVKQYKAIGTGSPHAAYYLKRYYHKEIKMKEFTQLADFVTRYVSNSRYPLEGDVGLDPNYPYPQVIYIPDDPRFCKPYNDGESKSDCSPTLNELKRIKSYSDKKLKTLHGQSF